MLISTVIPLTALNASPPETTRFLGREAHALFLDLVRRADPALAESLHEPRGDKPFTVSGLLDPRNHHALAAPIHANAQYEWRITAFEPRLAHTLAESVLPNLQHEIRLGSVMFQTGKPITDHNAHEWANITNADQVREKWFAGGTRIGRNIGLEFASPTTHRQIHRNVLFPMPAQLWGGWLRAWNKSARPAFEDDLIAQVEEHVSLSRYALKTEMVDFGEHRAAGWVGHATMACFSEERALARVLHLLADFAFYCGTGYKTTQGMGMTRRIE